MWTKITFSGQLAKGKRQFEICGLEFSVGG